MTEPHDLDELASAQLDGTLTAEEAALLAADPALRGQVEARAHELHAVQRAIADVPPVDPVRRDAAIAAALATFDDEAAAPAATVTPLAPRRRLSPLAVRALSAAAVVLLLALLVPLLTRDAGDDETATFDSSRGATEDVGGRTADGGDAQEEAVAPQAQDAIGAPTTTSPGQASRDLGSYDDLDALAAAVASGERSSDSAFSPGAESGPLCGPPTGTSWTVSQAEVAGEPVEVYVRTANDGTRTMIVRAAGTCELLDERDL